MSAQPASTVSRASRSLNGDKVALSFLGFLFLLVVEPVVLRNHVTVPNDNRRAFLEPEEGSRYPQLPSHADVNRYFVPILHQHFQGDHVGWTASWFPHVQFGMLGYHSFGLSKAYPITYVLSFFTHDPYRLQTWLSVATVGFLVFFAFAFLRSLHLHPAAALAGSVGLALNTRNVYWFTFTLSLAWVAWSLGIMWLSVRFIRRPRLASWLGIVFCSYCLIIGARHQATIRLSYLLVPFILLVLFRERDSHATRAKVLAMLALALGLSLLLSYPILHDLAARSAASTRFGTDTTEFILEHWNGFFEKHVAMLWNVFAFGNPSRIDYPLKTPALNFTPFFFALLAIAFITRAGRRAWLFTAVFTFFLAMSMFRPFYAFAVEYLGFGFSRGNPIGGCYVPGFVVCAFAIDSLLADRDRQVIGVLLPLLAVLGATLAGVLAVVGPQGHAAVHWGYFSFGLVLAGAAAVFVLWRSPLVLYAATLGIVLAFVRPALIHRPLETVARSSSLADSIRERTPSGHRFAKFGDARRFLPSDQEILVGLRSIHSYDSLSSVSYGRLTKSLSDRGAHTHGRHFDTLDSEEKLRGDAMSYTGISAILSDRELPLDSWEAQAVGRGLILYSDPDPPPLAAQIVDFDRVENAVSLAGPLQANVREETVEIVEQRDDSLSLRTKRANKPTLLFVSSQFHEDWSALADRTHLQTVRINEFYLGVLLPPGRERVELRFLPWARWAWLPLLFFAIAFSFVTVRWLAAAAPVRAWLASRRSRR